MTQIPESIVRPRLAEEDWLGALGVFLLVFLSLFPVGVPFIFVSNVGLGLRISNGVALVLLFLAGYSFAASLIAILGERGLPWSFWGSRWSVSRSSLEDEVALQIAASSARDAADSPCQVLLFVSLECLFVNRITVFYNMTPVAGVPVLSNMCDQFRTSEALARLRRSTTGLAAIARRAPVQANGSRK